MRSLSILVVLAFVLCSCNAVEEPAITLTQVANVSSAYDVFPEPATLVIRDQQSWEELWARMHHDRSPQPAVPAVDFSKNTLLVGATGVRPNSAYSVTIAEVFESANGALAKVTITTPGTGCNAFQVITSRVNAASIPRHDGTIQFEVTTKVKNCE